MNHLELAGFLAECPALLACPGGAGTSRHAGGAEAVRALVEGDAQARLTREAKAAIQRLAAPRSHALRGRTGRDQTPGVQKKWCHASSYAVSVRLRRYRGPG